MDVKLTTRFSWQRCLALGSLPLLLAIGEASEATANEAIASDAEVTSTIFISDDDFAEPIGHGQSSSRQPSPRQSGPPQWVEGSIVFVEDSPLVGLEPAPAVVGQATNLRLPAINQPPVRGDLTVVSHPPSRSALAAVGPLSSHAPSDQQPIIDQQPIAARAVIRQIAVFESEAAPAERDLPGDIQIAVHAEPVVTQDLAPKAEAVSLAELLITAHRLSHQAETAAEYSRIAHACAEAIRLGADLDQRDFARQLSSWALNRRGQLRADAGEQELAIADFQTALDFNPRNWRALHNRGVMFAQAGQFAEAFDDFNAVIQLAPNYAKAYANRATLYVQAKDLQSAIKDYKLALHHDSEFATAHVGLGRVCHTLGRWEEAVEHFSSAVQLAPNSADIVCSRGDLQADLGRFAEALADYARTIELDPEFAHAYRNGAWLLATCPDERYRDPENAVLGARQALEYSYGDRHVALDTLAAALASQGEFEAAIQTETEAVDLAPEDAKFTYLSRLKLYQDRVPFRTEPVGDVSQVMYESNDQSADGR